MDGVLHEIIYFSFFVSFFLSHTRTHTLSRIEQPYTRVNTRALITIGGGVRRLRQGDEMTVGEQDRIIGMDIQKGRSAQTNIIKMHPYNKKA